MIKSAHEIALMQLAKSGNARCLRGGARAIKDGMTQRQVEDLVAAAYGQLDSPVKRAWKSGNIRLPHGSATQQIIREGSSSWSMTVARLRAINRISRARSCSKG